MEFPSTAVEIVPERFPAVRLVRLAPETAPNRPDQVPVVTVPVVVKLVDPARGEAPRVLYEIVRAADPSNVVPDAAPVPLLLKVAALVTLPAVVAEVAEVAVVALPLNAAVIVPAEKPPEASLETMVETVFALVALEVTVKVEAPDWFAVKVAEPERPTPETPIVRVPSPVPEVKATVPVLAGKVIVFVPAIAAA